ncbi:haloacid dehalogenase type II [Fictibacillus nanhaiensis]|uniref:haloacid dehalogenase type II n=1 Tax=Fictibacillus nanhaiensis TaxID=742169 RepID=UPI002E20854F|nr:haloacid dehalogenase type II [Fictibacillus nanhaiensis]MED1863077.1 haloacid dehalogenase type II [Fictibacillus nanhaiensis]
MTIKAYVYDAYGTLFDVHSVTKKAELLFEAHGKAISEEWRKKQVEYFMLHQLTGRYIPFSEITRNALLYTLKKLSLQCNEDALDSLMEAYLELKVYEEVHNTLHKIQKNDVKQVIFSNGTYKMLEPLVKKRELTDVLDLLSIEDVKQYKPAPGAYQYAQEKLCVNRDEILFLSSNFWDITGAATFGFKTAWINRGSLPLDVLGVKPHYIFSSLNDLLNEKELHS